MKNEPLISINISGNQTLVFYQHFLTYKGNDIKYKDISGISYLLTDTKHSIDFIPTHTTTSFEIKLEANGQTHKVKSSAGSFMLFESEGRKGKKETFAKLVYVLDNLIKPFVIINLLFEYAKSSEMKFGPIMLKTDGIYKDRLWRSPEFLPWREYYNSVLLKGDLYIFRNDNGKEKYKSYTTCSMSLMNAVVMPDLLTYLFQKNGVIDKTTIKELEKRKSELEVGSEKEGFVKKEGNIFCWSCGVSIEGGQKFCTNCGSKIT